MMTKHVPVAKFELCSSLVGITIWPKWLFSAESVLFVVQEIVKVHTTRNLSQGGVCYMLIQILQSKGQLLLHSARMDRYHAYLYSL
jgi:hypothetical protein